MCRVLKNRINDLIDKGDIKQLDTYIANYLDLKKDFSNEDFSKLSNKDKTLIFNERYGTDFTEYEVSTIVSNATMAILYLDYKQEEML